MKYCGIDLHSNNSVVVIADEADRVVYSKRHANDLNALLVALAGYRDDLVGVVVESTFNWYWLVDGLLEAGYRVHLANTAAIKQYEGLKHRGDESDARQLARLLRLKLLPEGYIMPKADRAVRDIARKRMQLVQQRSAQILSIESSLARHTGGRISSNAIKALQSESVGALGLGEMPSLGVKAHVALLAVLQEQIEHLEQTLRRHCRARVEFKLLRSAAGIGEVLATVILLETGEIGRFAQVGHYASYCRCVGSEHLSNGKPKGAGNTKNGNRYLAWAYVEAANFAVRFCEPARRFYQRKKAQRNHTVAIKAVAHKLARACYHMLKEKKAFSIEQCFG